jgi:DNA-binding IclR family transcriptional regulator
MKSAIPVLNRRMLGVAAACVLAFGSSLYMVAYSHDLGPVSLQLGSSTPQELEGLRLAKQRLLRICESVGNHTGCLGVWGNHGPTIVLWKPSSHPVSEQLCTGLVASTTRSAVVKMFATWLPTEVTKSFVEDATGGVANWFLLMDDADRTEYIDGIVSNIGYH